MNDLSKCLTRSIKLIALDLDGTLIQGNISASFGAYLYRNDHIKTFSFLRVCGSYLSLKLGLVEMERLHTVALKQIFLKRSLCQVEFLAEEFIGLNLERLLFAPLVAIITQAREMGCQLALFSSSPQFLVAPIAKRLNFNQVFSTRYLTDPDTRFSGKIELLDGEKKASQLSQLMRELQIGPEQVLTFSDSEVDLPFLKVSSHPIAVKPTRRLRFIARQKKWGILDG